MNVCSSLFFKPKSFSVPFCRIRLFLLFSLHPYYSRAGGLQFCSTIHFYLILKLILMITLYCQGENHQGENHQKSHFPKLSGCYIIWHFCDVNSSTEMRPWELQKLVSVCSQASSWSFIIWNGFILIINASRSKILIFEILSFFHLVTKKNPIKTRMQSP